jgi:hypothetical protein
LKTTVLVINIITNIIWFILSIVNLFIRLVFHTFSKRHHDWEGWKEIFSVSFNFFPLIALLSIIACWILYGYKQYPWALVAALFPLINVIVCIATLFSVVWE